MLTIEQQRTLHNDLVQGFTTRYIEDMRASKFARPVAFDPSNPVCDYNRTVWEVQHYPFPIYRIIGEKIIQKDHSMSSSEIDKTCALPFTEKTDQITDALRKYPVLLVNDHSPDTQSALSIVAAQKGIARGQNGNFLKNYLDIIRISHVIGIRALHEIEIPLHVFGKVVPFAKIETAITTANFSIPLNKKTENSNLDKRLVRIYNKKFVQDTLRAAENTTSHPQNYYPLFASSIGGDKNYKGTDEHQGLLITHPVVNPTVRLLKAMKCALLPVYTSFGRGKRETYFELGDIVPPDEVTDETPHQMMADIAEFRRAHGEPNVYYAGELDLAA